MAKWARIEDGVVMETTDIPITRTQTVNGVEVTTSRFHPSLVWVACPEEVEQRWTYVDGTFTAPA